MSELDIILKLQSISNKFLNYLFFALTQLGSETFFIATAVIIFWCISKRAGYKFINVYIAGQFFTTLIKISVQRKRPYQRGAKAILEKSDGFSFPSGHSQSIANISTQTALMSKGKKFFRAALALGATLTAVVMFTRMYLGQHYLSDVLTGAALGVAIALFFWHLFALLGNKEECLVYAILPLTIIFAIVLIALGDLGDVTKVLGAYGAVSLGYFIEKRKVGYEVKSGSFCKQILKIILGGIIIIGLKEGLKHLGIFIALEGRFLMMLDYIRYFLIAIFASLFAPMMFKRLKI